jgi:hypothetical protein
MRCPQGSGKVRPSSSVERELGRSTMISIAWRDWWRLLRERWPDER